MPCNFLPRHDLKRAHLQARIDRSAESPLGRSAVLKMRESRGQRVLDAPSSTGGASQDGFKTASLAKRIGFNTAFIPLDMMPPRPTVIAHGKVLRVVPELRV